MARGNTPNLRLGLSKDRVVLIKRLLPLALLGCSIFDPEDNRLTGRWVGFVGCPEQCEAATGRKANLNLEQNGEQVTGENVIGDFVYGFTGTVTSDSLWLFHTSTNGRRPFSMPSAGPVGFRGVLASPDRIEGIWDGKTRLVYRRSP